MSAAIWFINLINIFAITKYIRTYFIKRATPAERQSTYSPEEAMLLCGPCDMYTWQTCFLWSVVHVGRRLSTLCEGHTFFSQHTIIIRSPWQRTQSICCFHAPTCTLYRLSTPLWRVALRQGKDHGRRYCRRAPVTTSAEAACAQQNDGVYRYRMCSTGRLWEAPSPPPPPIAFVIRWSCELAVLFSTRVARR